MSSTRKVRFTGSALMTSRRSRLRSWSWCQDMTSLGDMAQSLRGLGEFAAIGKRLWQNDSLAAAFRLLRRSAGDMLDAWLKSRCRFKAVLGVDLGVGRGRSGEPLQRGLRLCAAAPRVRRGERQGGRVGTRHRRNGRDHAGHGTIRWRIRRPSSIWLPRCAKFSSRETAAGCRRMQTKLTFDEAISVEPEFNIVEKHRLNRVRRELFEQLAQTPFA